MNDSRHQDDFCSTQLDPGGEVSIFDLFLLHGNRLGNAVVRWHLSDFTGNRLRRGESVEKMDFN